MRCRYQRMLDTIRETYGDTCTAHGQPWPCPRDPAAFRRECARPRTAVTCTAAHRTGDPDGGAR